MLFGVFTSHVTGNIVLLGVALGTGQGSDIAKLMTLPVFVLGIVLTCLFVHALERSGRRPLVPVLVLEFLLLAALLTALWRLLPFGGPDDPGTLAAVAIAVSAMAVQNALMRRVLRSMPSTTVMTSNLTQVTVDFVDAALGGEPGRAARERLRRTVPVVLSFAVGAAAAGLGYLTYGFVSLAAALAGLAIAIGIAATLSA